MQAAEDAAYRDADVVVSMLPKVHEHMAAHGLDLRKLHIVPNGISLDDWQAAPPPLREDIAQTLAAARERGCMVVGYAGSMGLPNALDTLLDAAAALRGVALCFVLVGDGHEKARLARRVADEGLSHVSLFEPIPKAHDPVVPGRHRHRLHRLAARADLPLRHRAEQADGLHDGRRCRCCTAWTPATTRWPKPAAA